MINMFPIATKEGGDKQCREALDQERERKRPASSCNPYLVTPMQKDLRTRRKRTTEYHEYTKERGSTSRNQ
jgi:hypothetical protein